MRDGGWWRVGLGFLVGAVLHTAASAQEVKRDTTAREAQQDTVTRPAGPDTSATRADSVPRVDTTRRDTTGATTRAAGDTTAADSVPRDTVKAPLARAESPPWTGIGEPLRWDRATLFATGALTLLELLERVPGGTVFRSGWLASPVHAAYLGDASRVRVFYDGVELDQLDPRTGGLLDLAEVQLWTLEEVTIERGAAELRIYLRSWRVDRTTAYTRTDVATGTQDTNLYRGFFGRRFDGGQVLQLAGQQYGTTAGSDIGGGDQLSLLGRFGWARGGWTGDGFVSRVSRTRDLQERFSGVSQIPGLEATRTDAYLRAAYGDPERGGWAQLLAAIQRFEEASEADAGTTATDTVDTTRTHSQYVAAGGVTRGSARFSLTNRLHVIDGDLHNALSARLAIDGGWLAASLYAERRGDDTTSLEELAVRVTPLSFLSVSGAVGRQHGRRGVGVETDVLSARGELGVRLSTLWLSGGVLSRQETPLPGLAVYDTTYGRTADTRATGVFGAARGRVWRDIFADMYSVRWSEPGPYRPQIQTHLELFVRTNWLSRFPSGNFGFLGSIAYDYRSPTSFPTSGGLDVTTRGQILSGRLEVRILSAVLFWQQRYRLQPLQQDVVPGYPLPRQIQLYGVRWEFWN